MMHLVQSVATSSLPLAPSQGTPLITAPKNPLGMSMGTSRFAGGTPKTSASAPSKKSAEPKSSWNRELDFSGNTKTSPPEKENGWVRHNKRRSPRDQDRTIAPTKDSEPCNPPTSTASLPAAPAVVTAPVTRSVSPIKAVSLRPTAPVFVPCAAATAATSATTTVVVVTPPLSEPSSPTTSADPSEPPTTPTSSWKQDSKVKKEHIIYLQRRFKDGLEMDEIAKQTAAEFPELCKGMRNGYKTATEETRLEAVGDAIFMHTRRYAVWYV